jgi:hypothetical protein
LLRGPYWLLLIEPCFDHCRCNGHEKCKITYVIQPCAWVDKDRFTQHTRDAYGRAFPAPLSYILPWLWRRQVTARMPGRAGGTFHSLTFVYYFASKTVQLMTAGMIRHVTNLTPLPGVSASATLTPGYDDERVMLGVADAYGALASRLADGGGQYFFGDRPSSLDAIAFAHLAFHAHSPVVGLYTLNPVDTQALESAWLQSLHLYS